MKKKLLLSALALSSMASVFAGGILTNTNQSAHFLRNPARDASTEIDAVYTNPAGLSLLPDEGFHFSLTNQSAFQTRTITSTFEPFTRFGGNATKVFEGEASAPVIPSVQAAYKKGDWVLSGSIAVTGGGGKATFNNGLPSFEAPISMIPEQLNANGINTTQYSVDAYMEGSSIIYGAQLGGTYKINDMFSVYGGFRMNFVNNGYIGHLKNISINPQHPTLNPSGGMMLASDFFTNMANSQNTAATGLQPFVTAGMGSATMASVTGSGAGQISPAAATALRMGLGLNETTFNNMTVSQVQTAYTTAATTSTGNAKKTSDTYLDCDQSGWGITPVLGLNFNWNGLNIGMKYEFMTNLNVENKTKVDDTGMFKDGVNTPHDIPALFTIGAQYDILPSLTVSAGYHHFFDSDAGMALIDDPNNPGQKTGKQNFINGGTNEYLGGLEWRINPMFLISGGIQFTRTGVTDNYQQDLSYSLNSYSVGLGGAVNVSKTVRINIGYLFTNYEDWTKVSSNYNKTGKPGTDVFSRTNKVFGAGVDFRF